MIMVLRIVLHHWPVASVPALREIKSACAVRAMQRVVVS
jgi:hypothetical protein